MARRRTGTVIVERNAAGDEILVPFCTLPDGSRRRLKPCPPGTPKDEAKKIAAHWTERFAAEKVKRPRPTRSQRVDGRRTEVECSAWVDAWLAQRERRGLTSVRENGAHWRMHLLPLLGDKHPRAWTPAELRAVVAALDGKVLAGELAWKTAINIWGTCTAMCRDAARSKVEALRCREDDPAQGVLGPDRGPKTAKQYLHPSEASAFFACEEVPIAWRELVAVAIYTYMRAGELRVLRWEDVDLEHGTIHVHRAHSRVSRAAKPTKGARARRVGIEPALMPLLRRMAAERAGELVCARMGSERTMARSLRRWLLRAGVERRELHEAEATRKAMTFHDLRATGLTWCAVRGDDPLRIQQRAGHTDFQTTQGYVRTAEELRAGFGEVFPSLPPGLGGPPERLVQSFYGAQVSEMMRGGRDSNPRKGPQSPLDSANLHSDPHPTVFDPAPTIERGTLEGTNGPLELAILEASKAGRWDIVAMLARELEARRLDGSNVVALDPKRGRR